MVRYGDFSKETDKDELAETFELLPRDDDVPTTRCVFVYRLDELSRWGFDTLAKLFFDFINVVDVFVVSIEIVDTISIVKREFI